MNEFNYYIYIYLYFYLFFIFFYLNISHMEVEVLSTDNIQKSDNYQSQDVKPKQHKKFQKVENIDLTQDEYYNDVKNLLIIPELKETSEINNVSSVGDVSNVSSVGDVGNMNKNKIKTTVRGTYARYGKNKACDLDIEQLLFLESSEISNNFINFIINLENNKHKFHLIKSYFKIKNPILSELYDKLGYIDGTLNILKVDLKSNIFSLINKLPDNNNLRNEILESYNTFIEDDSLNNYLKLKTLIKTNFYPQWSFKDVLKGEIQYLGDTISVKHITTPVFYYIEFIYKRFRVSNMISLINTTYQNKNKIDKIDKFNIEPKIHYAGILDELYITDNNINYYKLIKVFNIFVKFLYINRLIQEFPLVKNADNLYIDVNKFKEEIGEEKNKNCYIKNIVDIATKKINKYTLLNNKVKLTKYQKIYDKYYKKDLELTLKFSDICKTKYMQVSKGYNKYLEKYLIIK